MSVLVVMLTATIWQLCSYHKLGGNRTVVESFFNGTPLGTVTLPAFVEQTKKVGADIFQKNLLFFI